MSKRHEAYFNLHKHCLSIRPMGGKVSHFSGVVFSDASFVVSKAGRERVIREKRKNVHAFVRGTPVTTLPVGQNGTPLVENCKAAGLRRVTYNPYKYERFVIKSTGQEVVWADRVYVVGRSIYAVGAR